MGESVPQTIAVDAAAGIVVHGGGRSTMYIADVSSSIPAVEHVLIGHSCTVVDVACAHHRIVSASRLEVIVWHQVHANINSVLGLFAFQ